MLFLMQQTTRVLLRCSNSVGGRIVYRNIEGFRVEWLNNETGEWLPYDEFEQMSNECYFGFHLRLVPV